MLMAGLDGIQNKIHPGEASDKDLYHLPPEEDKLIPRVCHSLDMALAALDEDREFLKKGGYLMIAIKSQSIDVTKKPKDVYEQEKNKLEKAGFRIIQMIDLEPHEEKHAMIVAKK